MEPLSSQSMMFVTGASRSGTTLLAQIMGKHSEVAGLREMQYFGEFWDPRRGPQTPGPAERKEAVAALFERQEKGIVAAAGRLSSDPAVDRLVDSLGPDADSAEVFAACVAAFAARTGKHIPCEQTPRNIYYAAELLRAYPNARFVHLVRDPRGVMASQKFRWRRRALMSDPGAMRRTQQWRTWVNYHPYSVAQLWSLATRLALRLSDHPRFKLIRFEDLLREPEATVEGICNFLGIDFQNAMLDIEHVNSSYVSVAGSQRGMSQGSIDAWRTKLTQDEQALVYKRCSALMEQVGYVAEPTAHTALGRLRLGARYVIHAAGAAVLNPGRLLIQAQAFLRRPGGPGDPESAASSKAPATAPQVFGLRCEDTALDEAAAHLVRCARNRVRQRVAFVHAHCLNVSVRDAGLREALTTADVIYADGIGMAMAARLQGERLHYNVNGTDLFPLLCAHAAAAGVPLALLGAAPGVAEACREVLEARYPGLRVAWCHHGYLGASDDPALSDAAIIEEINRSRAGILLVAMGVPLQERWLLKNANALEVPVVMGVGALFDFVADRIPRAPALFRKLRLEWLFRLMVEPRRMFGRYVLGNPLFLARACKYAMTGSVWPENSSRAVTR